MYSAALLERGGVSNLKILFSQKRGTTGAPSFPRLSFLGARLLLQFLKTLFSFEHISC